jgi:hypothetical protein
VGGEEWIEPFLRMLGSRLSRRGFGVMLGAPTVVEDAGDGEAPGDLDEEEEPEDGDSE